MWRYSCKSSSSSLQHSLPPFPLPPFPDVPLSLPHAECYWGGGRKAGSGDIESVKDDALQIVKAAISAADPVKATHSGGCWRCCSERGMTVCSFGHVNTHRTTPLDQHAPTHPLCNRIGCKLNGRKGSGRVTLAGHAFDLSACKHVLVIAAGKSAVPMGETAEMVLLDALGSVSSSWISVW